MRIISNRYYDDNNNSWSIDSGDIKWAIQQSKSLIDCYDCINCSNCNYCNGCRDCSDCRFCRECRFCSECIHCSYCRDCSDFKSNPNRYTFGPIGSRKDFTTTYWIGSQYQVICGCFKGTLEEFAERVREVHGDNEYGVAYMQYIEQVKGLM